MTPTALVGATIVTPDGLLPDHAVVIQNGMIAAVVDRACLAPGIDRHDIGPGWLLPGFIDTQVNGGGDVLLNDEPTVAGVTTIARAHRRFGTTGLLPTLISDRAPVVDAAVAAVGEAVIHGVPGVLGIHVEGPHLNVARRGIHDAARFSRLDAEAVRRLTRLRAGVTLVTLAPELAPAGAIRALVAHGVVVAAGHSEADYAATVAAIGEGVAGFTHLFNAMTPFLGREPGMVGAALEDRSTVFGLIVDGRHVHPATMRVAVAARGVEGVMLVTDAMPPVGGERKSFTLMGRDIAVIDGTCRATDGTLAGSALTMAQAFRNAMDMLGLDMVTASRMASGVPARLLRLRERTGAIAPGLRADLVQLDRGRRVLRTWIGGAVSELGE